MKDAYWIEPSGSKKYHIAVDGMSLCNAWMMTDKSSPVKDMFTTENDCKKCVKAYLKMKDEK